MVKITKKKTKILVKLEHISYGILVQARRKQKLSSKSAAVIQI